MFTRIADAYQALLLSTPSRMYGFLYVKPATRSGILSNTIRQRRETICGNEITSVGGVSLTVCLRMTVLHGYFLKPERRFNMNGKTYF
ncbi:hypothetical protein CW090_017475 [Salmonella enterica subsp. enterica serovar Ohio]|uniref:hypothetical protein n=1 Tax=Salmonella sp. s51228 TaxID=3159652 RepID=UPI001DBB2D40|nr:hypothetical protein [Salmonella enterica subsp. enterica serovar Ohio]EHT9431124.1 hypothetical protein [Salmonella enterica]EEO3464945.1 hypothetical protein [Salmonella enterica subsp. enterica serovar Ohio]EIP6682223.1 hypothetical protein [Salmonella enterica subsp. enterica serovar Ohio]EJY1024065.1 hypothetical protein [Salmonella enterica]